MTILGNNAGNMVWRGYDWDGSDMCMELVWVGELVFLQGLRGESWKGQRKKQGDAGTEHDRRYAIITKYLELKKYKTLNKSILKHVFVSLYGPDLSNLCIVQG